MRQFLDPERAFPIGALPDYEPRPSDSVAGIAPARRAAPRWKCSTTSLLEDDGHELVMRPLLNYTDFSLDAVREMLLHPTTRVGPRRRRRALRHHVRREHAHVHAHALGARPRARPAAARVVVNKMTAETASLYGLGDRGALAPGMLGDVNVIDFDHAAARPRPVMVHDLPGDARRFVQGSRGYVATVKSRRRSSCATATTRARAPVSLLRGAR